MIEGKPPGSCLGACEGIFLRVAVVCEDAWVTVAYIDLSLALYDCARSQQRRAEQTIAVQSARGEMN